jgi:predicted DNA-binding transcriptional regulator YafY
MTETAERLLRLLSLLTARRNWTGEELAARLQVTPRTVRRDVERLRALGYQVHAISGPAGGYELRAGTGLPPLLLDDDAAVAVAVGLRAAATGAVAGMEEAAARAATVIDRVLPDRLRRRVKALQAVVVPLPSAAPQVAPEVLTLLALACRDSEQVRFRYVDGAGRESRRLVEPYRLVSTGPRWYLVARDTEKGAWRSFRLDRLADPLPTGQRSRPADPPDAVRFVIEGISFRPYRYQARVLVKAPAIDVASRIPSATGVVEAVDDASCLLITGSDSLDAIVLHLALLGPPFIPLEPPELRERCAVLSRRLKEAGQVAEQVSPDSDEFEPFTVMPKVVEPPAATEPL